MNTYKCYKCGKDYETKDIRFTSSNRMSCVYCQGIKQREIKPVTKIVEEKPKEEMADYICGACSYSFKRKKSVKFNFCPYCNKEGTVSLKKTTGAKDILEESTSDKYDF